MTPLEERCLLARTKAPEVTEGVRAVATHQQARCWIDARGRTVATAARASREDHGAEDSNDDGEQLVHGSNLCVAFAG